MRKATIIPLDNEGIHHFTIYNRDYDHPLRINGWNYIVQYFNLPGNVFVQVGYYDDNIFGIKDYKGVSCQPDLPYYHIWSLYYENIFAFDITLTHVNIDFPKLVKFLYFILIPIYLIYYFLTFFSTSFYFLEIAGRLCDNIKRLWLSLSSSV